MSALSGAQGQGRRTGSVSAFSAALDEGFCPECLVPLVPHSNLGYCPVCRGYWSRARKAEGQ